MPIPSQRDTASPPLEQRLQALTQQPAPRLDLVVLATLAALALVLPLWPQLQERAFNDVLGQAMSVYLLPALGMLLAVRCGAIDLSVWANMALGGAVSAAIIRLAGPVNGPHVAGWAMLAGSVAGLIVGIVNGLAVKRLRLPSPLATIVTAAILTGAMAWLVGGSLTIPDSTFAHWHIVQSFSPEQVGQDSQTVTGPVRIVATLTVTRMLIVAGAFSVVLVVMLSLAADARRRAARDEPPPIVLTMALSGLLSALGGALWLIDQPSTPVPDQLVGTMRIPAAVVLAGGLLLAGSGRTNLTMLCLPVALAIVSAWRWSWPGMQAYEPQVLVLIGVVLLMQLCARKALRGDAKMMTAGVVAAGSLLTLAAAGRVEMLAQQQALRWSGIVLMTISLVLAIRASRRRSGAPVGPA